MLAGVVVAVAEACQWGECQKTMAILWMAMVAMTKDEKHNRNGGGLQMAAVQVLGRNDCDGGRGGVVRIDAGGCQRGDGDGGGGGTGVGGQRVWLW